MRIKRYEGQYVHEVIEQIREELGPDAVVLHTRWSNPTGLKKLLGRPQVEVWAGTRQDFEAGGMPAGVAGGFTPLPQPGESRLPAALVEPEVVPHEPEPLPAGLPAATEPTTDDPVPEAVEVEPANSRALALHRALLDHAGGPAAEDEPAPPAEPPAPPRPQRLDVVVDDEVRRPAPAAAAPAAPVSEPEPESVASDADSDDLTVAILARFQTALERLEKKVDQLSTSQAQTAGGAAGGPRQRALCASGVTAEVAAELDAAAGDQTIAEVLLDHFQCTGEIALTEGETRVVALVGPSGVGKTTTLGKLAARFGIERGARVMLASTDVKRIGTFEQLRALGELMQLNVCSLRTPNEAQARIRMARGHHDLILVDTAASGVGRREDWDLLVDTLIAVEPDEIHVVLPATMKPHDLSRTVEHFTSALPLHGVVVTKLDESADPGILVNLSWRHQVPFSYIVTGPAVPGEIELATPERLLRLAWSARLDGPSGE